MASMIEGTLRHAQFLARHLKNCNIKCATIAILLELGVPTKNAGFEYLKRAIIIYSSDPTQSITKELYSAVGALYEPKVSTVQIEIAIRRAIDSAWRNRNKKTWSYYFSSGGNMDTKRPTNAEFISMVACFLELWQCCVKEGSNEKA